MDDCPHCGGPIRRAMQRLLHEAFDDAQRCMMVNGQRRSVSPAGWRLLTVMRERFRRYVPLDFLATTAAADPLDGGSIHTVRVHLCHLRHPLDGTPFAIVNRRGFGYGLFWVHEVVRDEDLKGAVWTRLRYSARAQRDDEARVAAIRRHLHARSRRTPPPASDAGQ
jgi:hypothetical protein